MRTAPDASAVLMDGPWQHRFVAANGARFHVAEAGEGPLVLLLHGFPQMWWAWRAQIPALARAGYRVAAMDLRGSGASDKPPQGYDVPTLTRDVAGVIRSLGVGEAVVVGHGLGGTVAWSMPTLRPAVTRAVAVLGAVHPARMHTAAAARPLLLRSTSRHLAFFQLPWFPERRLTRGDLATRLLREWGAGSWLTPDAAATYRTAMQVPFAAHSSMETLRWLVRSTPRVDGQRYLAAMRSAIEVPVLQVHGGADRCLPSATVGSATADHGRPFRLEIVPEAGHFLPEEAAEATTSLLLDWLATLD
ncbi:MAG: alpha/beta hydrolase [Actinomycetales bacterium]|nr:alpha/beta hydrolase [Actinomycetales bacterium]